MLSKLWSFINNSKFGLKNSHLIYIVIFILIFIPIQRKVFKKSIDLNGDNVEYYLGALAIHQGDGYASLTVRGKPKTNNFPVGYPFLMSLVMNISTSITTQKIFNSVLLGLSCLLIFVITFRFTKNRFLSLVLSLLPTSNFLILHFATMMMSEMSCMFFSLLAIWALFKLRNCKNFKEIFRDPYFYVLVVTSSYSYHIRTQGIAFIVAFIVLFLLQKRWKYALSFLGGFIVCFLPWFIRNKVNGLGTSRYFALIFKANAWRPEEGHLTFGGVIKRMFSTTEMLITKAFPDTIIPGYNVNYGNNSTFFMWVLGIVLIVLIVYGFWKFFKKDMLIFLLYIIITFGMVTLWVAPAEGRYLVTIIPFLQIGCFLGALALIETIATSFLKIKLYKNILLLILVIFSSFAFYEDIKRTSRFNKAKLNINFQNYFKIAETIKKKFPKGNIVVCSRKPQLFYMYSNCYGYGFSSSLDDKIVIQGLLQNNIDFVVLDNLGYSSTYRYLIPAIRKNQELFKSVMYLKPATYLLWFDKAKAKKKLNIK